MKRAIEKGIRNRLWKSSCEPEQTLCISLESQSRLRECVIVVRLYFFFSAPSRKQNRYESFTHKLLNRYHPCIYKSMYYVNDDGGGRNGAKEERDY